MQRELLTFPSKIFALSSSREFTDSPRMHDHEIGSLSLCKSYRVLSVFLHFVLGERSGRQAFFAAES